MKKTNKQTNKTNSVGKNVILFSPNIRSIINNHWYILNINKAFGNVFNATSVVVFCKNIFKTIHWYNYNEAPNETISKTSEYYAKLDHRINVKHQSMTLCH